MPGNRQSRVPAAHYLARSNPDDAWVWHVNRVPAPSRVHAADMTVGRVRRTSTIESSARSLHIAPCRHSWALHPWTSAA